MVEQGFFSVFSTIFSDLFPKAVLLTTPQKFGFVFLTLFIFTLLVFIAFWKLSGSVNRIALTIAFSLDVLLLLMFVAIGYINVVFVFLAVALLVVLVLFKGRSS